MSLNRATRNGSSVLVAFAMVPLMAAPLLAQEPADPDPRRITFTGGVDVRNTYMFRGVRQDDTGVIMWPYGDVRLAVYTGDGALKSARVQVGTRNSMHSGVAGSDGLSGRRWYESDVYGGLDIDFGPGVRVGTTYTAYVSPNDMFTAVKEIALRLAVDDRLTLAGAAIRPYALVAFELDAKPGIGQVDGGFHAGRYLELGVAPAIAGRRVSVAFPVKIGLSAGNYYELAGEDHTFGFASIGGMVTVPIGSATRFGAWNVHGGVEYQALGTTTKAFNDGESSKAVAAIGVGFSY